MPAHPRGPQTLSQIELHKIYRIWSFCLVLITSDDGVTKWRIETTQLWDCYKK